MKIAPSVLAADFANLASEIKSVQNAGAEWLHLDVMDGHFVPNMSIGFPVIQSIRKATDMFLDVHIMISAPLLYAERFCKAGADLVCFHIEACKDDDAEKCVEIIHSCGKLAAVSIKPKTPVSDIVRLLPLVDMVLVMTVEPGFGGQSFMEEMMPKVRELKLLAPDLQVEIDGGINRVTASVCAEAGADILVAGSYVFGSEDRVAAIESLRF